MPEDKDAMFKKIQNFCVHCTFPLIFQTTAQIVVVQWTSNMFIDFGTFPTLIIVLKNYA